MADRLFYGLGVLFLLAALVIGVNALVERAEKMDLEPVPNPVPAGRYDHSDVSGVMLVMIEEGYNG